ncbi:MAG: SulP family inorganic anion transporter [Gammaproteobacteria bacterium]|jgi:SulP family sulfate permease|nr:STAS domain-containing protein [Gammaproteobacteria bacterium]
MNLQYQLNRFLPFLRWGRGMTRSSMRADAIAGLTGAAIVLPQGVAFAAIAGMPPEYGLYTSMVPAVIAALFGSSWHLVSGPTTAASVIMFASLSGIATPGSEEYVALAITLAFMVGVLQLIMGVVRLGALVNFISHSVVVGFTAGAACLIAAKQAEEFLGIDIPDGAHLLATLDFLWQNWRDLHPLVTLVALITLLSGILAQRRLGGMSMIAAMVAGSIAAALFNLAFSEETSGIHMVGALPQQLPPLSMPQFSLDVFRQLSPLALAMTLFALTEAVSIARSISLKSGQPIEGNQEFIGQGLSNILGSFFSSYVATGSFNRSGANYDAGARTPMAAALAGVLLVVLVLLVAPLTSYLPKAAVAGLLFLVAWRLINFSQIRKILRADQNEAAILGIVFFGTVFFSIEFAILAGVILSLMIFLRKTSRPRLSPRVPDPDSKTRKFIFGHSLPECPQLKILRLDDSLYFGSVAHVGELLRRYREHYPGQKHLLLLTKGIAQVDVAGAELLIKETRDRRAMGGDLYLYRLRDKASKVFNRGGYADELGEANIFDGKLDALSSIFGRLDKSICATCENRIFLECQTIDKIEPAAEK